MNWGTKIVLGLAAFMLFIMGSGIYMVSHDSDTLIEEDYYEKSLNYDEVYNRKQNLTNDDAKVAIVQQQDTLVLTFTSNGNQGEIIFKRPSDGSLDQVIPLITQTETFNVPISTFQKGNWALEINWEHKSKKYTQSQSFFIQ